MIGFGVMKGYGDDLAAIFVVVADASLFLSVRSYFCSFFFFIAVTSLLNMLL